MIPWKMIVAISAVFVLILTAAVIGDAEAAHKQRIVVNSVVAVPVAVPVATFSPVQYQNQVIPYTDPPKSAEDVLLDMLADKVAARLQGGTVKAQAEKPTLFATNCAACHKKGDADKGKPSFTTLDALTPEQRLKASRAILEERMPPGKKLSPAEVGQHLLELSTLPSASTADAPPKPQP